MRNCHRLRPATCDLRPGKAERARDWGIPKFTTNCREVLARADVDVVLILTGMQSHGPLTRDALNAGKHVLVEKPMSMDLAEAADLVHWPGCPRANWSAPRMSPCRGPIRTCGATSMAATSGVR